MMKGTEIMDSYVFKDSELAEGDYPNQNYIVGWVLRTVMIPNINPHQIMKTAQALIKQAIDKKQDKKVIAPISETKEIELDKVPVGEVKRQKSPGWVKEEGEKTTDQLQEEHVKALKERAVAQKTEEVKADTPSTVKTTRKLPTIPGAASGTVASAVPKEETSAQVTETKTKEVGSSFCPYCGKDLEFKFCPYCGKPLPHKN